MNHRDEKNLTLLLLAVLMLATVAAAQDLNFNPPPSLFTDKRAFRVGDVVTILLQERSSGTNEANTNSDSRNRFDLESSATGALDFIPGMGMNSRINMDNRSSGLTSRSGRLEGKLAARVVEILPGGNLRLEGRRTIEVNGEEQITILTGLVRPNDIMADNSIYSYLIADASITYRGKGMVDHASKPGIIIRFLSWLF